MSAAARTTVDRRFRTACGMFATGVTAVTAIDAHGELAALTVNSFTSVSMDPQQILVCIAFQSSSYPVLSTAERLAVHVLTDGQEEIARRLATAGLSGAERLSEVGWLPGPGKEPHISHVAARLAGRVSNRVDSGDHVIIVVDVDHVETGDGQGASLVFLSGRFVTVDGRPPALGAVAAAGGSS